MRQAFGNTVQEMLVRLKVSFKIYNIYLLSMTSSTCATDGDAVILAKKYIVMVGKLRRCTLYKQTDRTTKGWTEI